MKSITNYILAFCLIVVIPMGFKVMENDLLTINVNSAKEQPIKLSEIAEKIEAIELEMTNNSLMNITQLERIHFTEDYIVVCEAFKIMLFDKTGKFIRQIGSQGQGPGEFSGIVNTTADIKKKHLYVLAREQKIICYTFEGEFVKEIPVGKGGDLKYINYMNNNLLYLVRLRETENDKTIMQTVLLTIDDNSSVSAGLEVNKVISNDLKIPYVANISNNDNINYDGENVLLYNTDFYSKTLHDTLYQLKNNQLIPYLKLKFSDADYRNRNVVLDLSQPEKAINVMNSLMKISNIYKSSRYVFSVYSHQQR